jgi:anion-transporting  ArsA/GET3 family ATPase
VPSLLDKRLLIVSGKGGAGKSTAAAAMALAAARRGKRVLIVEIGEEERITPIFGAPRAGYEGAPVYERGPGTVWAMCLTAPEALREYAMRSVKFEMLYEAVFENRVMRYFTAAAPGLDELTIMGKIEFLQREQLDPARPPQSSKSAAGPRFDLMIFDAPATGHGLAFVKVPRMAMSMARVGPLHAMAERMWRLLADPARTAFNIVAWPEEMSVNESIELHAAAEELGLPRGKVIVNGVHPDVFSGEIDELRRLRRESRDADDARSRIARAALEAAVSSAARREADEAMVSKLAGALPQELLLLPFLSAPSIGVEEIEALADRLEGL